MDDHRSIGKAEQKTGIWAAEEGYPDEYVSAEAAERGILTRPFFGPAYTHQIMIASSHFDGKSVVIWGTHWEGLFVKQLLEVLGFTCCFFVNSWPKADTCYGIPLFPPDALDVKKHYVVDCTHAPEVHSLLMEKGFEEEAGYVRLTMWHDDIEFNGCFVGKGTFGHDMLTKGYLGGLVEKIGAFCSINDTARIWSNHPIHYVSTNSYFYSTQHITDDPTKVKCKALPVNTFAKIEIGNDVWIGANVVILPGVKIGDGAICAAGAIVNRDVEPYSIVGGVPAKFIKYRFPKKIIDAMLRIKWWDWPMEKIEENYELFRQPELFCEIFDTERKEGVDDEEES